MKTVGIVGAGVIASQVHLPILLAMDDVRVAWITDANPVVSRSVAASNGVEAVSLEGGPSALRTVDVVLIAIPLPPRAIYLDHFATTETALLVEKPLSYDVEFPVEAMGRARGAYRDVVLAVRRFREQDSTRAQDAMDLAEHGEGIVEVLENIVADDDVEARIRVRSRLADAFAPLVEMGVTRDPRIGTHAADAPCVALEVPLGDDSGACPEVEHILRRTELRQGRCAQERVVPARLEFAVSTAVESIPNPLIESHARSSLVASSCD